MVFQIRIRRNYNDAVGGKTMSMQIKNIVLYNEQGEQRVLPFRTNSLNIITGASKSGKSALIKIVDYCLGAKECSIYTGVIRESVEWFGLHLEVKGEEYFIARKRPDAGKKSSEEIAFFKGKTTGIPEYPQLAKNISSSALSRLLSEAIGIESYSYEPSKGQTRSTGSVDIGKALIYCFLDQDDVDSSKFLFHRQGEPFLPQSIRDYMPYFLGAVDADLPRQKQKLRKLKHDLKVLKQQKSTSQRVRGESFHRSHELMREAQQVGLLSNDIEFHEDWPKTIGSLKAAADEMLSNKRLPTVGADEQLHKFLDIQQDLRANLRATDDEIRALQHLQTSSEGYVSEASEQKARLQSIEILPVTNDEETPSHSCPLCGSTHKELASTQAIYSHIEKLSKRLEGVSNETPEIDAIILEAKERKEAISNKLRSIAGEIEDLQKNNERIQKYRDLQAQQAMVKGRLSLYLDALVPDSDNSSSLDDKIALLEDKIQEQEDLIGNDNLKENLESFLHLLSSQLSEKAKSVGMEHSEYPLRLDANKLTVIADTLEGPRPMDAMGSGETWVSLHVIVYLILQKWFTMKQRPVPRFLFIDQPSQAYFLPEASSEEIRRGEKDALRRIYRLIASAIEESGDIQVIVTDHADIDEDWFQESITEKWWDGTKLVPSDWVNK